MVLPSTLFTVMFEQSGKCRHQCDIWQARGMGTGFLCSASSVGALGDMSAQGSLEDARAPLNNGTPSGPTRMSAMCIRQHCRAIDGLINR
jgi:hypothetical protein